MLVRAAWWSVIALVLLLLPTGARAQLDGLTTFDVPNACVGPLGGTGLTGINDSGQIIGWYSPASRCSQTNFNLQQQAFLYSGGSFTTIGVPSGPFANGINNSGQVVGSYRDDTGMVHGFFYGNGTLTTFDAPAQCVGPSGGTELTGINDSGQIIGWYQLAPCSSTNPSFQQQSFLYSGGSFIPLGGPNGAHAYAINNSGQVVGMYQDTTGMGHGFVYTNGTFATLDAPGECVGPYGGTALNGINDAGQIIGWYDTGQCSATNVSTQAHSFLYSGGNFIVLDSPGTPSLAGINNSGQIVGDYLDASNVNHGFIEDFTTANIPLFAAVLPLSRSVQVGATITAFATIINGGSNTATACTIAPATTVSASFLFQTTDPATNALTGTPNTPVDIAAGASQSFLIAFTTNAAFAPTNVALTFTCADASPASSIVGVNTIEISASASPVPDVVALAASGDPGYVDIPGAGGSGAFAVATVNLGSAASMTVGANTGAANLPVTILICETDPSLGTCLASPTSTVVLSIGANATPTFGIFVTGSGTIADMPGANRVFVTFTDAGGTLRGETSVAVRTH